LEWEDCSWRLKGEDCTCGRQGCVFLLFPSPSSSFTFSFFTFSFFCPFSVLSFSKPSSETLHVHF